MGNGVIRVFVPEYVPLTNKGEEAILRGYENIILNTFGDIKVQFGILGDVNQIEDFGNIRIFPRRWVENSIWPSRLYRYSRLVWDALYVIGLNGRIKRLWSGRGRYQCLSDFWKTSDLIVVGHDGYFKPASAIILYQAKRRKKIAGILGCGFYPPQRPNIRSWFQEKTYCKAMRVCDFAIFREKTTYQYMRSLQSSDNQSKAILAADPAFLMQPLARNKILSKISNQNWYNKVLNRGGKFIGATICQNDTHVVPFLKSGNSDGTMSSYWNYLAKLFDGFINTTSCGIIFLPHSIGVGRHNDLASAKKVINRMNLSSQCQIMEGDYSAQFMKGVLAECDFLIGQRTHSLIGAVGVQTPFVGITSSTDGRTHEIIGKQCGLYKYLLDIDQLDVSAAIKLISEAFHDRLQIIELQRKVYKLIEKETNLVSGIIFESYNKKIALKGTVNVG